MDKEAVERACVSLCESFGVHWSRLHQSERETYRKRMRAALEAALGDMVRDVQRYRHMRKDGVIWRVNMLALAKDDIDILFDAKADAAIDAAMQAKEAK